MIYLHSKIIKTSNVKNKISILFIKTEKGDTKTFKYIDMRMYMYTHTHTNARCPVNKTLINFSKTKIDELSGKTVVY